MFATKEELSKIINAKQFSKLVEVQIISGLLSSSCKLWFLMIMEIFCIIVVMYKYVLLILIAEYEQFEQYNP